MFKQAWRQRVSPLSENVSLPYTIITKLYVYVEIEKREPLFQEMYIFFFFRWITKNDYV